MEKNSKLKWILLVVGATVGVYIGFRYFLPLFAPFVIAYFLSKLILPVVRYLERKIRMPRSITGITSIIVIMGGILTALFFLVKGIFFQLQSLIKNIPVYQQLIMTKLEKICGNCDGMFGWVDGTAKGYMQINFESLAERARTEWMPAMTQQTFKIISILIAIIGGLFIIFVATVLIINNNDDLKKSYESSRLYEDIHKVTGRLSDTGMAFVRAQVIIMFFTSIICTVGLMLIKNKYALLIGIGIALFDAFPVLGSGLILIPWCIILLLQKNIFGAIVLLVLYLACQLTRQFLEPKLIGDRVGIKPIYSLMAMYVGVQLFGVFGFLLGPLSLIIIKAIVAAY